MQLPSSSLFCPKLTCYVYDYVYSLGWGGSQPLIGTFSINLGDVLDNTAQIQLEEVQESQRIINSLKKILKGKSILGGDASPFSNMSEEFPNEDQEVDPEIEELKKRLAVSALRKQGTLDHRKSNNKSFINSVIGAGLNLKVMNKKLEMQQQAKVDLEKQRAADQRAMKKKGSNANKMVVLPHYKFDDRLKIEREVESPPPSLFIGLGHNENKDSAKKHYRRYYPDELENVEVIFPRKPFHEEKIFRAQMRSFKSFFGGGGSSDVTAVKEVGFFKGQVKVYNLQENAILKIKQKERDDLIKEMLRQYYLQKKGENMPFDFDTLESFEQRGRFSRMMDDLGIGALNLASYFVENSIEDQISRLMLSKTKAIVRVYMIEGFNFANKDIGGASDPYLVLTCGKKVYNERDNYQLDQNDPVFYKMYEFDAEFPGAHPLNIQAYDYDDLFGDDIIGETTIDLDDRFFNPEWASMGFKPIEYRHLYHKSSSGSQGVVKLWVEINPQKGRTEDQAAQNKVWDIKPRPQKEYEVRVVVWDTKDVAMMDIEGTSDVFIKAKFEHGSGSSKETDTHYRCKDGIASFNYRLLFDFLAPAQ